MIHLTSLDGNEFVLNAEMILSMEANPDTRITLTDDRKYIVRETVAEVVERTVRYQRAIRGILPQREGQP